MSRYYENKRMRIGDYFQAIKVRKRTDETQRIFWLEDAKDPGFCFFRSDPPILETRWFTGIARRRARR